MDRRTATTYFAIQGVAGIVWWVLLFTTDLVRDLFFVDAAGWDAGRSILIADVAMFAGASLVTAWLVATSSSLARPAAWVTVGATAYATLVAVGWVVEGIGELTCIVGMLPSLALTAVAATAADGSQ